ASSSETIILESGSVGWGIAYNKIDRGANKLDGRKKGWLTLDRDLKDPRLRLLLRGCRDTSAHSRSASENLETDLEARFLLGSAWQCPSISSPCTRRTPGSRSPRRPCRPRSHHASAGRRDPSSRSWLVVDLV